MSEITHQYVNLYEKLFTFGPFFRVLSFYTLLYVIYIFESYVLVYPIYSLNQYIFIIGLPLYSTLTDFILIKFIIRGRDSQVFSLRRILGKHYLLFILSIGYLILSGLINQIYLDVNPSYNLFALLSIMIFVDLLIYIPILYNGFIKSYLLTVTKIVPVIFLSTFMSPDNAILISLITPITLALFISSVFYLYINNLSKKAKTLKAPLLEYLKGYVDSWILDDPHYLDNLLNNGSINIKTRVDMIVFPDSYPVPTLLLIPYFHYGPFKNVGSSSFPAAASSYMYSEKKLSVTVFHTPSNHELDISTNEETLKIIRKFTSFKDPILCNKISDIVKVTYGGATAYGIRFCRNILVFLEYKEMEDIPPWVIQEIENYAFEKNFENVSIIDCHNSLVNKSYILSPKAVDEIIYAAKDLIDKLKRVDLSVYKIANEKVIPSFVTPQDGLGSNGISIIYYETINASNCIITFDSNNLSPKLKMEVENTLNRLGIDKYVICTTDTHEVTALDLVKGGYRVLGEDEKAFREIIKSIEFVLRRIRKKLRPSDIHFYRHKVLTRVLGYDLIEKLGELSTYGFKMFKRFITFGTFIFLLFISIFPVFTMYI